MERQENMDSFKLLEEKIEILIKHITSLREEKASFEKMIQEKERSIANLTLELENLKENRDKAKERITSILEKIEELDI